MEEKEISAADVKAEFEKLVNNGEAEATEDSSTLETEASESTSEVVKPVTEEVEEGTEEEPKVIPYTRFKEVNSKLRELEELAETAKDFIVKDPITGKLTIKVGESPKEDTEDKGLQLSEEEQIALDSTQISVINKLVERTLAQRERQADALRIHNNETGKWWNKAQEEFPEIKDKNSSLYKKADQILREQYVVWGKDKKSYYIPPNAHYLSCLQAEKELSRDKVKTQQAKIEEKKTIKQQVFVEKKSNTAQSKKKVSDKDLEEMSYKEQEDALRDEWNERNPDE